MTAASDEHYCADHGALDADADRTIHAYLESDDKRCPHCGADLRDIEATESTWPLMAVADHVAECAEHDRPRCEVRP